MILKKLNISYFLSILIVSSFLLRLIAFYFFGDDHLTHEWKNLVNNLIKYKSYSYYSFEGNLLPSVYMPPAYPIFLYLIKLISFNNINFINLAILLQVILSTYSVYIFYKINNIFFPENISIINSFIFSYFPLNIYAAAKISSISLQIFFSLLFLQFLFLLTKNQTLKNIIFFSIISGLLILTRSEFILIFLAIIFLCFLFKKIKLINLLKIILIILIVVSPYVIRNYFHFRVFNNFT